MWVIGARAVRVNVASVADKSSKADVLVVFGITGDLAKDPDAVHFTPFLKKHAHDRKRPISISRSVACTCSYG